MDISGRHFRVFDLTLEIKMKLAVKGIFCGYGDKLLWLDYFLFLLCLITIRTLI